jgi:acyl-CoA hydrolase/RimJ/RimL family protein N-acetyltransferase
MSALARTVVPEENLSHPALCPDDEQWRKLLETRFPDKVRSPEQAIKAVQPGQRVFLGTGCAAPKSLVIALEEIGKPPPDVELVHFLTTAVVPHDENGRATTRYRHRTFFVGSDIRAAVAQGVAEYVPIQISQVPELLGSGLLQIDIAMIQVSVPDKFGYVSFGVSVDVVVAAVAAADLVIAEINPAMPRTQGESSLHVDEIDIMVPVNARVTEYVHEPITEQVGQRIARYIAGIIDDGSTLQIGLGRIPNEAMRHLCGRRDLGIHSDVITDAILPLLRGGILSGGCKTMAKGKVVASFAIGSRALYDALDGNSLFCFQPIDQVADESIIAAQHKMVSITQGFSIDLTGQVCVDQFEGTLYGGLGAQIEFARGAARSPGGKPIVCLSSTTDDGQRSRVKAMLAPGEAASLSRSDIHFVVTEFGIAYLHGKSIQERALALISIAHPAFRDALLKDAKRLGYVDSSLTINCIQPYAVEDERVVKLRDGRTVTIRPAMVVDASEIKSLFHALPANDRYTRFFHHIRTLSKDDIQRLCNPDYKHTVAYVAVSGDRRNGHIVGHGAYFRNPASDVAETAFMVAPTWQHVGLGSAIQSSLVEHAKRNEIRGFLAEILPGNASMIQLAKNCTPNVTMSRDGDLCHVTMMFQDDATCSDAA